MKYTHILLVASGSTHPDARRGYLELVEGFQSAFPTLTFSLSFTSHRIRGLLKACGEEILSPRDALKSHAGHWYVQPLHLLSGSEYRRLIAEVDAPCGPPLMEDFTEVASFLKAFREGVAPLRGNHEGIVLMGHGNPHEKHPLHQVLAACALEQDPLLFYACAEGEPGLPSLFEPISRSQPSSLLLLPCMTIAGIHARRELFIEWLPILERIAQVPSRVLYQGVGSFEPVRQLWYERLQRALDQ